MFDTCRIIALVRRLSNQFPRATGSQEPERRTRANEAAGLYGSATRGLRHPVRRSPQELLEHARRQLSDALRLECGLDLEVDAARKERTAPAKAAGTRL